MFLGLADQELTCMLRKDQARQGPYVFNQPTLAWRTAERGRGIEEEAEQRGNDVEAAFRKWSGVALWEWEKLHSTDLILYQSLQRSESKRDQGGSTLRWVVYKSMKPAFMEKQAVLLFSLEDSLF